MNVLKEANENSFPAQRWLFEVYETPYKEMSYGVKAVASVIALCAWNGKDTSFPSYNAISDAMGGAGQDTISNAVKKLTELGFLAVSKVKTKAGHRNDYRLVFPNTLETKGIETEANTLDTPITLDTGGNTLDTPVNHFGYEGQSLHTGGVEAIKETPKEAPKETITMLLTQPCTTYNNDLGFLDEELPNIEPLIPLDAFARVEHKEINKLFSNIQTSTDHIDRAVARKDFINAKKRSWGVA